MIPHIGGSLWPLYVYELTQVAEHGGRSPLTVDLWGKFLNYVSGLEGQLCEPCCLVCVHELSELIPPCV